MRRLRPLVLVPLLASPLLAALAVPSDVTAQAADPAARGLDLFVDLPHRAAPGATMPLQIQAFGFPTAVTLAPLAGAAVEAVWDPESLGPGVSKAPPPVKATTDAAGRLHLDVPVPEGDERSLKLLLGVTHGDHHRTIETSVSRIASRELSLIVPDERVVPGGATSAWAILRNTGSGEPAAGEEIIFELLEGGVARYSARAKTDSAGTAMGRVPIPWTDEPSFRWKLSVRSPLSSASAVALLAPREETPGEPQLNARWSEERILPGDRVTFTASLRDASDKPVAGAPVRYWIGQKGTDPPSIKDDPKGWERVSTLASSDVEGMVRGAADAPKTLRKGATTSLRLVVHTELYGHALHADRIVDVVTPSPEVNVVAENGRLVPGVAQALVMSVRDPRGKPVAGSFIVEGDGLSQRVTTNAWGEAEVSWHPPRDVGAGRNVGPCAGGVAAAVTVRPASALPALGNRTEPFSTCVVVDRDAAGIVRADKPMISAGGALHASIALGDAAKPGKPDKSGAAPPWSVMAAPVWLGGPRSAGAWLDDAARGLDLPLPSATPGTWRLSGAAPSATQAARTASGRVIVTPRMVPKIDAKIAGGRAAPLGTVEVDVDLSDGKGRGVPGSVAAILIDMHGGGATSGLWKLDTRQALCTQLGVERELCDPFFDDPGADTLRRRILGEQSLNAAKPERDPGGTAQEEMRKAFKGVLLSLEGAVMEASSSPDTLRDAFRKEKNAFTFNPELLSLTTAAMDPPPVTPGGEPIALGDLVALDRQVTFDNVARRVTRLKLFRVLAAVRQYRTSRALDDDEPVLRDPNAILRRLVTSSELTQESLLDPWGGTMAFVKAAGARMPFVNVRGFELHAPGPDGKAGTPDDVKGPFDRVVASGTPYAKALDEDRLVDSALDMEVGDATVSAWQSVLEELTGQALGSVTHGSGTGTGQGFGAGGGRLHGSGYGSGTGRVSSGIATGAAWWSPPQRTDDKGHLRLRVPLGDVETTWRLALVGAPDGATPAVTSLDIPSSLPLSARVEAGASWIEGDEADVVVTLRNRTASAAKVALTIAPGGVAELVSPADKSRSADVAPGGVTTVALRVRARTTGSATLDVTARAPGSLEDRTTHSWDVRPAGELVDLTSTQWVSGRAVLALSQVGPGLRAVGSARVVLERGNATAIEAALSGLEPDAIVSLDGLSYAQEAASRIQRWAIARSGENDPLALRAGDVVRRSAGRLLARKEITAVGRKWSAERRALRWAPADLTSVFGKLEDCPSDTSPDLEEGLALLEAEPPETAGAQFACWDTLVGNVVASVTQSGSNTALARALLALAERPHRAAVAASLADKLRAWVELRPSGGITLPPAAMKDRASRALVFAALLRAAALGKASAAPPDKLAAWLRVQRDAQGGYGSALATLAAVRALLSGPAEARTPTKVTVIADGVSKEVSVAPDATVEVALGVKPNQVEIVAEGPSLVARLMRPGVRLWSSPPDNSASPIAFEVKWPEAPKLGEKAILRVTASTTSGRGLTADVRIPLPPGVGLAEGGGVARQIQGQLVLRTLLDSSGSDSVVELPIRFGLAGRFTVPEARARIAFEEGARTIAPARPLIVK